MRRIALFVLVVVALSALPPLSVASAGMRSGAQDDPPTTTEPPPAPNIIPRPNQGSEPTEAGDRGGALQVLVFGLMVGAIVGIGAAAVRTSRKARRERGF